MPVCKRNNLMNHPLEIYRKWFFRVLKIGIVFWFVGIILLPIYGLIYPWQRANQMLQEEGITGIPLLVGSGFNSGTSIPSSGPPGMTYNHETWIRSYIVIPDSFPSFEIFTYVEVRNGDVGWADDDSSFATRGFERNYALIPFIVLWVLSGIFTFRLVLLGERSGFQEQTFRHKYQNNL
jgi:hypothetical protein